MIVKNGIFYYIVKIININSTELICKFYRKSIKFTGGFVLPTIEDIEIVKLIDIIMILPEPTE